MHSRPAMRRELEIVLSCVVIVYGVRTAIPLGQWDSSTGALVWRAVFGLLLLSPGVVLLRWPLVLSRRWKALLGVAASNIYVTAAILGNDWTRWGSAAASLGLSGVAFILYAGARAEGRKRD